MKTKDLKITESTRIQYRNQLNKLKIEAYELNKQIVFIEKTGDNVHYKIALKVLREALAKIEKKVSLKESRLSC